MTDKFGLGSEVRELKIGQSFTNPKACSFHAIRYDFKPASVDINKSATIDVSKSNQVTLTVPHLDGAGVPQTVFKGSQKPFQKECVLIIDKRTGEITLEKLTSNIQVKKTRSESAKPSPAPPPQPKHDERLHNGYANSNNHHSGSTPPLMSVPSNATSANAAAARSQTPPIGQRQSNKTKVTSGSRRADRPMIHMVPKHSPLQASPNHGGYSNNTSSSATNHRSPKRDVLRDSDSHNASSLASLPIIGMDDFMSLGPASGGSSSAAPSLALLPDTHSPCLPHAAPFDNHVNHTTTNAHAPHPATIAPHRITPASSNNAVAVMSDSSSSSSSDSDDDDEDDDDDDPDLKASSHPVTAPNAQSDWTNTYGSNSKQSLPAVVPNSTPSQAHILKHDLDLSESGSDSD